MPDTLRLTIFSRGNKAVRGGYTPKLLGVFLLVFTSAAFLHGCTQEPANVNFALAKAPSEPWQYPLRLGDTRSKVHELLSSPKRTTKDLEEYPASGVTVSFDDDRRVTKLGFAGTASEISSDETPTILTDRPLLFGLTSHTDEAGFRRVLGMPARETQEHSANQKDLLHCIWKKDGYIIEGFFLSSQKAQTQTSLPTGSLIRVEVYRGL
jgi:hypothetical protein